MEEKGRMERLDRLLVQKKLTSSRTRAKALIEAGLVRVDGKVISKASFPVSPDAEPVITGELFPYVGRGGLKLEKALETFSIDLKGAVCLDVGASTGGFTDCMLTAGAARVYAIDSGRDQLADSLRKDERVISMEETNMRYVTPDTIGQRSDFAAVDVSFISLTRILLPVKECLKKEAGMVCLIKPQFEAGKAFVGKKGVVKDKKVHKTVLKQIMEYAQSVGLCTEGLTWSPVRGQEGNIEFLIYLRNSDRKTVWPEEKISEIVRSAHESVDRS